jgi:hypothetical protein
MPEVDNCGNCGEEASTDSDFCPHCGVLFEQAPFTVCDFHRDREAEGVCIICRKFVCDGCAIVIHKRLFCAEHQDVVAQEDFARVHESNYIAEAESIAAMLKGAGFEVVAPVWGARGRLARVFVPIPEYVEAIKLVHEWKEQAMTTRNSEKGG